MKKSLATLVMLLAASVANTGIYAQELETQALAVLKSYLPGTTAIGPLKVEKLDINDKKKTLTVRYNGNSAYVPFTKESLQQFKNDLRAQLSAQYKNYKLTVTAADDNFDELVLFSQKKYVTPKEKSQFVTPLAKDAAPLGLDGTNIALWQSHGWYFEPKLNRWEWQRARIFQTVEDLFTQSYVMPYLMPMLENAGAYVMSPRERDVNTIELIVDNDGEFAVGEYIENGDWQDAGVEAFAYKSDKLYNGDNPFRHGSARKTSNSSASATWSATIPEEGSYAVYVSYPSLEKSTDAAIYTIHAANGDHQYKVNQQMGGRTWIYLGHFPFEKSADNKAIVTLDNGGKKGSVLAADAIKIGGGYGNIARIVKEPLDSIDYQYTLSNYPRFTEGARYFLQWAGAPDSVFTPTDYVNDYTDDYRCRGLWVNWLAGGSSVLPKREGLKIPVDLSFAFHSDAGTTLNDSIIGTLGIYSTANGKNFPNGMSHMASRDLTDLIMTNIVDDIRAQFEPNWTRRGMWDKSYFEARVPEVPAMLLELLSHQNFADMKYGLDPAFRFTVSRAIYKGMLKFIAHRDGREYVVEPLAVKTFAISLTDTARQYRLSWQPTPDTLEPTAAPTYYIIEERTAAGGYRQIAKVSAPEYIYTASDTDLHAFRIVAGNKGGVSFPSETLALQDLNNGTAPVLIVNGFTRVSAPDWFEAGDGTEIAGFYDTRDHGVPYVNDISFIGSQFEYRRNIPWMDDDAAGFGASRANYETKVIAGNTFDYVIPHGQAIAACGRSFISTGVDAFIASEAKPQIIDLILGKQKETAAGRGVYGTKFKTFPESLQSKLKDLTEGGTNIFVSGAYVATDLWDNPYSNDSIAAADQKFATEVLGYHWRVGQASVTGEAYQVDTRFKAFTRGDYKFSNELNADCYAVESPDSFYSADAKKGATFMRYSENNLVAGTVFDNSNYRTVVIGFPFETILDGGKRTDLMNQILNFFDKK